MDAQANPWRDCDREKPPVYIPVTILLPDGSERLGFWSGTVWVAAGAEVKPTEWRPRF
jgi:hypothetical protein